MVVRGEPCYRGEFDEARFDAGHLRVRVEAGSRGRGGRWVWRNRNLLLSPLAVIPLSDESAPILNRDGEQTARAEAESGPGVAFRRGGENVQPREPAPRKLYLLAVW